MADRLRFVVLTPHAVVLDEHVESARVPTATGQVGLRPRGEPLLTALEPGLVLFTVDGALRFAATAGGLFEGNREQAVVYTPFAVVGEQPDELLEALDEALATPESEIAARRRLGELEDRIVEALRGGAPPGAPKGAAHV
jgi:F0F1-type ATP synthase epsilon subunit